jgi:hypothetical protein
MMAVSPKTTFAISAVAATGLWNARVINVDLKSGVMTGAFAVNA